jgi:lipopolysaccharide export system protein LptC
MERTRGLLDRLTSWSPVLLLAGLAALTYWLNAQVQPPAPRHDGSTRHDPDLYLVDFRALDFDAAGRPRESLAATRGEHFPDDASTELTAPTIRLTQPDRPPFTVTAARARITGDRENAYFEGNVVARRDAEAAGAAAGGPPAGPITLTTDYLHVIPKTEQAQTDRAVTIREPRGIIEAVGMTFDNKTKLLKLKSRVSGTFEPQALPQK